MNKSERNEAAVSASELDRLIVRSNAGLGYWFENYTKIRKKNGITEAAKLNALQRRVCDAIQWCLDNEQPIRLIILKPRQKGASTIAVAALYWFMCRFAVNGVVIGGQYDDVDNMWEILGRYVRENDFEWGFGQTVQATKARFGNGAKLEKETARDENAGRSGTFQAMLATEAARWREGKAAPPEKVITGIQHCMPDLPRTIAILDSTANGPNGFYYDKWQGAVTLEQRQNGVLGNGWIRVFAGWHEFDDSRIDLTEPQRNRLLSSYSDKERLLVSQYDLQPEQVAFRRRTIEDDCQRDPQAFDMDFPACPTDAFRASNPSRFNSRGLTLLRSQALSHKKEYGIFDQPDPSAKRYVWRPIKTSEDAGELSENGGGGGRGKGESDHYHAVIYERPIHQCRYILPVDVMTGEHADGDDPDNHAAMVIRDGYWNDRGQWRPPKLVARLAHPCRWDIDVLEEAVWRLSQHYGGCMIVPEENQDRGLIRSLANRGANLYTRTTADESRSDIDDKPLEKFGFKTKGAGENNRNAIIENLARAIREWQTEGSGIEIPDITTIRELENFIVDSRGRAQAAPNCHDDYVMALAIGLATIAGATTYHAGHKVKDLPPDLVALERQMRRGGGMYS